MKLVVRPLHKHMTSQKAQKAPRIYAHDGRITIETPLTDIIYFLVNHVFPEYDLDPAAELQMMYEEQTDECAFDDFEAINIVRILVAYLDYNVDGRDWEEYFADRTLDELLAD